METQTSSGFTSTAALPSLASSVLRNVFGGLQEPDTSPKEISRDSLMDQPAEIARDVLTRVETNWNGKLSGFNCLRTRPSELVRREPGYCLMSIGIA